MNLGEMKKEKDEVKIKFDELVDFIDSDEFEKLSSFEKSMVLLQAHSMGVLFSVIEYTNNVLI